MKIDPIFAAFRYPDAETAAEAWARADADDEIRNVSVWRSRTPDGLNVVIVLGEEQSWVDRAVATIQDGSLDNYIIPADVMRQLMMRRYGTAFELADTVRRGGAVQRQQRARYGEEGVLFRDGRPVRP